MTTVLVAGGGTGGHLMPALAIADEMRTRHPEWRVMLVGAKRGVEARLLPERDYPYQLLSAEPIYRQRPWRNARWPALAVRLWREVGSMLEIERPDLVVGTGGYASGPVVYRAARRGIPTGIFEADAHPGLTSRWLARVVDEIYLGSPEGAGGIVPGPRCEAIVTGPPIRPPNPALREAGLQRFQIDPDRPVLMITGGSQGASGINQAVAGMLELGELPELQVIWATGTGGYPDFQHLHRPPQVHVCPFLDPIGEAQAVSTIAVSRGGSLSLAEMAAWGIPGIVIPLPTAAADHQTRNAEAAARAGAVVHLPQSRLTAATLTEAVRKLVSNKGELASMRTAAIARGCPQATDQIVTRLEGLLARR
jgi:UDP-N-acetylglucosamine--N-acetylmuramyl-(pentapeptide) pyrophosphoryl-undecaprenol N-acetylglucosamine transferase